MNYSEPLFQGEESPGEAEEEIPDDVPVVAKADMEDIDFERKLEESLKDL